MVKIYKYLLLSLCVVMNMHARDNLSTQIYEFALGLLSPRCASNCKSWAQVQLGCQGHHAMCTSCLRARVARAEQVSYQSGNQIYVTCPLCNDMISISVLAPYVSAPSTQLNNSPCPSAPSAPTYLNVGYLCASNCGGQGVVKLNCDKNHRMCKSCLRSRVQSAKKLAQQHGEQIYVTCPLCNDMLSEATIRPYFN